MAVLTFKHENKEYTSKPFDFKAMCLVNEGHNNEKFKGPLMMCDEAVKYLFDDAPLEKLSPGKRAALCTKCWSLYVEELNNSAKND